MLLDSNVRVRVCVLCRGREGRGRLRLTFLLQGRRSWLCVTTSSLTTL